MPEVSSSSPECYTRITITKNTKGYHHETTVSVRWSFPDDRSAVLIDALLADADAAARDEIKRRERLDEEAAPIA